MYDCSAEGAGTPSLNDCLDKGPNILNDMISILLRFRIHEFAFTSDIEKAFLQVGLHESDRDYTKFFWLSDPEDPESPFKVYRFSSVLFGSVSSPAILAAVIKTHLDTYNTDIAGDMQMNTYVDNLISGTSSEEKLASYYTKAENGGFKLCEATQSDVMKFKPCSNLTTMKTPTKQGVLSQISIHLVYLPLCMLKPKCSCKNYGKQIWGGMTIFLTHSYKYGMV